jgi:hypothetical protein
MNINEEEDTFAFGGMCLKPQDHLYSPVYPEMTFRVHSYAHNPVNSPRLLLHIDFRDLAKYKVNKISDLFISLRNKFDNSFGFDYFTPFSDCLIDTRHEIRCYSLLISERLFKAFNFSKNRAEALDPESFSLFKTIFQKGVRVRNIQEYQGVVEDRSSDFILVRVTNPLSKELKAEWVEELPMLKQFTYLEWLDKKIEIL